MRTPAHLRRALLAVFLALPLTALAQPGPVVETEASLEALGGVRFLRPDWKPVREDAAVAVYERAAEPATKRPFYVLLVAVEEGPAGEVDWSRVRDNIVEAATKNQRKLTLEVGQSYVAQGFDAKLMTGTFEGDGGQKVTLELVGLVADGRLVTVSLISDEATEESAGILAAVARTVALGAR
ncbi:MAG: hypothetical protein CSA66_05925 [Proteobacteria bacterium]|nr:MAG: hypothetical protein CSA66_05925 [Pseudomonadota bacterium]